MKKTIYRILVLLILLIMTSCSKTVNSDEIDIEAEILKEMDLPDSSEEPAG